ncbi:hypothetical protein IGJ55_003355 [Enterococcus sp. AZ170]|uniref:hypothetical protein n=1 Tax=Enterococcus sp. AZ170 TaxID=2774747 RepID=UPI003D3010D9
MQFFIRLLNSKFEDPIILYVLGVLAFFSSFILAFVGNLISESFYFLFVNFLLLEYNYPKIRQNFYNSQIQHFMYSNKVLNKYLFFAELSDNLLLLLVIPYNVLFILFSPSMTVAILLSIIINLTILTARLLDAHAILSMVFVLTVVSMWYKNDFLSLLILSTILVLFSFMLNRADLYVKRSYRNKYSAPVKERQIIKMNYLLKYLVRLPLIKKLEYIVIIVVVQIMSLFNFKIVTGIDFFVFLCILEFELITDGFFKDIHQQASMYYFYKKLGVSNFKYYTLSRYFYSGIIYSVMLLLPIKDYSILGSVVLIVVTLLLSYVYYTFYVKSIKTNSKKNNGLSQFVIFVGLYALFLLKNHYLI